MLMLAKRWSKDINPKGWYISQKLDGYRAYWDGEKFLARSGRVIACPDWFTEGFPQAPLDGELFAGARLDKVASAVKGGRAGDWKMVLYAVFDSPCSAPFEKRLSKLRKLVRKTPYAFALPQTKCKGYDDLYKRLDEVVQSGGEGLMLRKPGSMIESGRSDSLLKVKKWFDDEAVVIGHIEKNRPGLCGSLKVMTKDGKVFKVASGLTEVMAKNPPPIGTIITYKYEILTEDGIPRPATFLRIRENGD